MRTLFTLRPFSNLTEISLWRVKFTVRPTEGFYCFVNEVLLKCGFCVIYGDIIIAFIIVTTSSDIISHTATAWQVITHGRACWPRIVLICCITHRASMFQVSWISRLDSCRSIFKTYDLSSFNLVWVRRDQSASFEQPYAGFSRDKNRKLLQSRKQRWPLRWCCNVGSLIRAAQHFLNKRRAINSATFKLGFN